MGWLFMRDMGGYASARSYLDNQFTYQRDTHRLTVLASAMVGSTYYAACERLAVDAERIVFAIVCLTKTSTGARDGCAFGYKDMDETVGPNESECPAAMGAALLDRGDPSRPLARTAVPILEPGREARGGYVPNVAYRCGGMVRDRTLLLPYGIADNYAAMGTINLDELLPLMS